MAAPSPLSIEQFVAIVRRRVNRHRLWTALIWSAAAGAGLLAIIALAYVLRGEAAPTWGILAAGGLALCGAAATWVLTRLDRDQSARLIDRDYDLQDAVASYLHFSMAGRREGYYALQASHTQRRVADLSPTAIRYEPPRRGMMLAAGLIAVAVPLSFRGPSPHVLERQRIGDAVEAFTAAAMPELDQLVKELDEQTDDPFERELVDPSQLRAWVDQLDPTRDPKEALRQFAQLERQLNAARLAVQRRRDEQLLDRAAQELENHRESRPLAEKLSQKQYAKAAEQLDAMTPQPRESASKARKALTRLKAAAQRMAAASRAQRASASSGAEGAGGDAGAAAAGGELGEQLEKLDAAVAHLDQSLAEAERQEAEFGKCDAKSASQCRSCQQAVASQLKNLGDRLKRLAIRRQAEQKLNRLGKACSQCQRGLCACQKPGAKPGANPGGQKAGWGSHTARRDARSEEQLDNGQTTQLRGLKGTGPSLSTVEEADDGDGVSARGATARKREFSRQLESFVQREDVPEQIKRGVKNYFQLIHQ